ncbi:aromatic amino acid lyase [Hymenobacter sp. BT507]|uniref:Aromatic amino acid lyase n=1 Tax=Hymenobacter citatus TaxID=2763506 RepID=A0ABR7MFE7_9BACT|nr:aromatic amino acid lyase [Hymenobacter citatus]MBC6609387.1 aromatic amino acid lyase [Hymenobacter citatus]
MSTNFLLTPTTPLTLPTLRTLLASTARVVAPDSNSASADTTATGSAALLQATACGVGAEVPGELVRLMLLLHAGQQQRRGASAATVRRLLDFYNREVLPVVYQQGGEQVALAHLSLPLFGLGEVNYQGYRLQAYDVLELFGWAPLPQADADVPALLAGSGFTLAYAVRSWLRAEHLLWMADSLSAAAQNQADSAPTSPHTACHAALAYVQQSLEEALTTPPTPTNQQNADTNQLATTGASLALRTLLLMVAELGSHSARRTERLLRSAGSALASLRHPVESLQQQSAQLCAVAPTGTAADVALCTYQLLDYVDQLLGIELLVISRQPAEQLPATAQLLLDAREQLPALTEQQLLYPTVHAAAQFVRRYARPEQAA